MDSGTGDLPRETVWYFDRARSGDKSWSRPVIRLTFSHIYFDPPGFSRIKERVYGANGAVDLATATWIEREKKGEIKLEVPDTGQDSNLLSLAFMDSVRGKKKPVNHAESAALSTLVAMMGRKAIDEKRVVNWEEMTKVEDYWTACSK